MFKDKDTPTTDEGICSGVELPAPWTTGKVVESPHPLKVIETGSKIYHYSRTATAARRRLRWAGL